nr:hypothetical protein [Gemmatimonadota bacterium]
HLPRADSVIGVLQKHRAELNTPDRRFLDWLLALRRGDMPGTYVTAKAMMNASPGSVHAIWETVLAAVRTNRPKEALELLDLPQIASRPEGSLLLQSFWTWKTTALHLLGNYEEELRVSRLGIRAVGSGRGLEQVEARALAALGRSRESLEVAQSLLESSTLARGPTFPQIRLIVEEMEAHGRATAARALADRAVGTYRDSQVELSINDRLNVAGTLYAVGRFDEARALLAPLSSLDSASFPTVVTELNVQGLRGALAARAGDRAAARAISAQLEARNVDVVFHTLNLYWRARIATVLGEREVAVALMRRAFAEGFMSIQGIAGRFMHSDPDLRSLLSMPEFRVLVEPKG